MEKFGQIHRIDSNSGKADQSNSISIFDAYEQGVVHPAANTVPVNHLSDNRTSLVGSGKTADTKSNPQGHTDVIKTPQGTSIGFTNCFPPLGVLPQEQERKSAHSRPKQQSTKFDDWIRAASQKDSAPITGTKLVDPQKQVETPQVKKPTGR